MRMSMVWEMSPPTISRAMSEMMDLMRAVASWAWAAPALEVSQSAGWQLKWELLPSLKGERAFLTLLLWAEPGSADNSA